MPEKPSKKLAIIIGGIFIGIITGTPLLYIINYCCCCAGIMLGGVVSLYTYRREFTDLSAPLESSDALIIGIFSGIVGAFIGIILDFIFFQIFGPVTERTVLNFISWLTSQGNIPTDQVDRLESIAQDLQKKIDAGFHLSDLLGNLIINLILCPIFSMLGGLIGYGIFGKKKQPVPPTGPIQ